MRHFAIRFAVYLLVLYGLAYLPVVREHLVAPFTVAITDISGWLIGLWDPRVVVTDNVLSIPGFAVQILDMCNGVEATLLMWAVFLAFPAPWRYRLLGMLLGTLGVHAVNILRIVSLLYLGVWKPDWFHWVHWYLWDALIMLDILLIFLAWLHWMPAGKDRHATALG
ncbi:exosortase H [Thiohalocapsa marina]|uniref:exosortase H n=1 Tax=Thiohalocapsa marina TaxID=424902 RepID=UPI00147943CF|nr:exosortase H [Thiohalocapsa marina]